MQDRLVSVIIPTYNRAYCIERTINSALFQTYANLEIIVIDDGSNDNTNEIIKKNYIFESKVKYIKKINEGVAAARNLGIKLSSGKYIAFLDSDDIWEPWKIELQVKALESQKEIGMVWTDMVAIDKNDKIISNAYLKEMYRAYKYFTIDELFEKEIKIYDFAKNVVNIDESKALYIGDIFSKMIMGNLVHTSTVLISRKRLDRVKGFNEKLEMSGEDYDFHLRTCREGPVGFINISSIKYQTGMEDQLTRQNCSVYIARNFLKTIQPLIESERKIISLPENMIKEVLWYGYRWYGKELLFIGNKMEALKNFKKSFSYKKNDLFLFLLIFFCFFPKKIFKIIKSSGKIYVGKLENKNLLKNFFQKTLRD